MPALSDSRQSDALWARAAAVKLAVFDVDGVMTNGSISLDPTGAEHKVFNVRDGQGLKWLREAGIEIGIISGRASPAVEERMAALGIQYVYQGQIDKLAAFDDLCAKLGVSAAEVACVGDDVPDLAILCKAGLAVAVADADPFVVQHCHWRTELAGGCGAVREVCELLLEARGLLDTLRRRYLKWVPGG